MSKKVLYYTWMILVSVFTVNTYAAPAVRKLGVNTNKMVAKSATVTQTKPATTTMKAATIQSSGTKNTTTAVSTGSRLPAVPSVKSMNISKNVRLATPATSNPNQPGTGGVSEEALNSLVERLEYLESQIGNTIIDVTETSSGNYVTDVSASGDTLNVTKTDSIYLPVRESDNAAATDSAEIYILK